MKIALTGGSGGVGRAIAAQALAAATVVRIDRAAPPEGQGADLSFVQADMSEYDKLVWGLRRLRRGDPYGGHPAPGRHPDPSCTTTTSSAATMRCARPPKHGITRVCQASSVNAIGHSYSREPRYDYFPLDEAHPNYSEDPTACRNGSASSRPTLSQALRDMRIASMRFHWVVPDRQEGGEPGSGIRQSRSASISGPIRASTRQPMPASRASAAHSRATRSSTSLPPTPPPTSPASSWPRAFPGRANPRRSQRTPRALQLGQGRAAAGLEARSRLIGSARRQAVRSF